VSAKPSVADGISAAPAASPAPLGGDAHTATTTTPGAPEPNTPQASSTVSEAANDNEPTVVEDAQPATELEEAPADTLLVDVAAAPAPEAPPLEAALQVEVPSAANDNSPPEELGATGTE